MRFFILFFVSVAFAATGTTMSTCNNGSKPITEEAEEKPCYQDDDGDGFGGEEYTVRPCSTMTESEAIVSNNDDCDDADPNVNPDADEYCDSIDNDCDDEVDEDSAKDADTWMPDLDGDGYGIYEDYVVTCYRPAEMANRGGDCDDTDPEVNPGEKEQCDASSIDDDCDGAVDEEQDADEDGANACDDCDDDNDDAYPDAEEVPSDINDVDENCDGVVTCYRDNDGDGYGTDEIVDGDGYCDTWDNEAIEKQTGDCDDSHVNVNPGAEELCNGIDDNCNDYIDELC